MVGRHGPKYVVGLKRNGWSAYAEIHNQSGLSRLQSVDRGANPARLPRMGIQFRCYEDKGKR